MPKNKKELTPEEIEAIEKQEEEDRLRKEEQEKKALEDAKREQLLREEELKRVRAEAQLEAMREAQNRQPQQQEQAWTEEQWKNWEEQTGMTRAMLATMDAAAQKRVKEVESTFEARIREAEERAKRAEERFNKFEDTAVYDRFKKSYLNKNPQFAKYEKEFDEFTSDYSEDTRKDPTKLEGIFRKAEVYIRGKVGGKTVSRDNFGSHRFGKDDDRVRDTGEEEEVDLSDLRAHERLTVEKALRNTKETEELKKYKHDLKGENGIMINGREEWDKYRKH